MTVPTKILEFIEHFDRNLEAYKQGKYNETQGRREFIDPFFEALGWDVANKKGYAEAYKDVVHEDAIKVGRATKAPDYCFRIGGVRKFFLEAKKPSVDSKADVHPAYQLRRYAWSAKLPLSILTDFEELAVYDCRIKPIKTDKASTARLLYFPYKEYPQRWEEIAGVFSREAILKGSFDKYVESKKAKRGTAEVDAAFLQEMERWREMLARNIALRNPDLTHRELNFAVQRTIDRIIFLRICEDRGVEPYGTLMALQNGTRVYQRLFGLFHRADERYNSGLFHFQEERGRPDDSLDTLTPDLTIDDSVLKDILKSLYYPDSPYEFSVLPADILGQVYEQFLGKGIRLTPAHRAVVEYKPEVRKAGGVYYTPTYIVDYIVKNTVGKLVEGKKPGPRGAVSKLRILDPAWGSGSFLLGAYQFLLDWHRDEYRKDGPERWATGRTPRLYQTDTGEWKLTTEERKRILLSNIYGVDVDPQAVEGTKLSLLLKVLEGEDEQPIARQGSMFQKRVLPDLGNTIKCGNALRGPDFYEGKQMSLLDEEEMSRINAFDWEAEFPEILKNGIIDPSTSIIYLTRKDDIEKYPNTKVHLNRYRGKITCREVAKGKHPWFALHRPRNPEIFEAPKFIGLTTTRQICVALDDNVGYYSTDALYLFRIKREFSIQERFVLGVLLSTCFQFLYQISSQGEQRVIPQIKAAKLHGLPFPIIDLSNPVAKVQHDQMVSLVERMLDLQKQLPEAKLPQTKTVLQRQIEATDRQIDDLVYELYGLTDEEIKIVEESLR